MNLRLPPDRGKIAGISSRRTWRRDQAARSAWSRARQVISAGDILVALRAYQPIRDGESALTPAPGSR